VQVGVEEPEEQVDEPSELLKAQNFATYFPAGAHRGSRHDIVGPSVPTVHCSCSKYLPLQPLFAPSAVTRTGCAQAPEHPTLWHDPHCGEQSFVVTRGERSARRTETNCEEQSAPTQVVVLLLVSSNVTAPRQSPGPPSVMKPLDEAPLEDAPLLEDVPLDEPPLDEEEVPKPASPTSVPPPVQAAAQRNARKQAATRRMNG
jgi:hypothetical protein